MSRPLSITKKRRKVKLNIPSWVVRLYALLAAVLVPWTIYLSVTLPTRHVTQHWDLSWGGFDIGLFVVFVITALLAYKKSRWVTMAATATGSFLLIDAWFDVLGEHSVYAFREAVIMAFLIEIPLSIISFSVAAHVLMRNID